MGAAGLELPTSADPEPTSIQDANLRHRWAQIRKLELEYDIKAGLYILRADSDTEYARIMGAVRVKIEQWVGGMAELFHDAPRERIAKLAQDRFDRICREINALERTAFAGKPEGDGKDAKKSKAVSRRHRR